MAGKYGKLKYPGKAESEFEIDLAFSPMGDQEKSPQMLAQGEGEEQDSEIPEVNQAVPQAEVPPELQKLLDEGLVDKQALMAAMKALEKPEADDIEEMDLG